MDLLSHNACQIMIPVAILILLGLTSHPVDSAPSTHTFQVQTLVVVDKEAFDSWKRLTGKSTIDELKTEIRSNMVDVTDIYKSLQRFDPPLTFGFEIVDIVLLQTNWFSSHYVNIMTALKALESWSVRQSQNFDLTLFYTGFDLTSVGKSEHGVAWIGKMCTSQALAVLEIEATYKDSLSIAHEIGHSLGSQHDGTINATSCPASDGFNMASYIHVDKTNHFRFSKCSYDMIYKTMVTQGKGKCLKDGDPKNLVKGHKFGVIVDPDDLCKRRYGDKSGVDRGHYSTYDDSICTQVKCVTTSGKDDFVATGNGMTCGKNKRCNLGRCETASDGDPNRSDSCPLGEQVTALNTKNLTLTCKTLSSEESCYFWKDECCQTCANYEFSEADAACRRLQGPKSVLLRNKYENNWGDAVCKQLYCEGPYFYQGVAHDTPEGMKCGQGKVCKNKKCVQSSDGDPNMSDNCPYGDRPWIKNYEMTCKQFSDKYGCSYWRSKAMCCKTCPKELDVSYLRKSADDVCQDAKGEGWGMAREMYTQYGDTFCSKDLNCVSGSTVEGETILARAQIPMPNGLTCGRQKVCYNGTCRRSSQGDPYASDTCTWGDQPMRTLGYTQVYCRDMPHRELFCQDNKKWCCSTCH